VTVARDVAAGATRNCPHCRATILASATVCPGCKHHLRFDPSAAAKPQRSVSALRVEGTLRHPGNAVEEGWEYSVVIAVRNVKGEEISRQVVGVGAIPPSETRSFEVSVELVKPASIIPTREGEGASGAKAAPAALAPPGRPLSVRGAVPSSRAEGAPPPATKPRPT
jgi:hypothetical protein